MLDLTILRVLKHRELYDRIMPALPSGVLDDKTMILLKDFGSYFEETNQTVVKPGIFKSLFFNFYHKKLPPDVASFYNKLIDRLSDDVDAATTKSINNHLVELCFATDVGNVASDYHSGKDVDVIATVGDKHATAKSALLRGDANELFVSDSIDDLLSEDEDVTGLRFSIACLRDGLRPLRGGDFVIVAGRPDLGKTTFILSAVGGMASQLQPNRPIVWFNNEGQGNRITKRSYQALLGATIDELLSKRADGTLDSEYAAALGDTRFHVIDIHDWTNVMVEDVCEQLNPGLVIFDMIDNITFKGDIVGDRTDQMLESMYKWARTLAAKQDFVVFAASQVSADAEQQADTQCYPQQHMLKDSKTGKQGAADLMIMLGKSPDPSMANVRFISTPKNKCSNGRSAVYVRAQVNFDGARAQYLDPV